MGLPFRRLASGIAGRFKSTVTGAGTTDEEHVPHVNVDGPVEVEGTVTVDGVTPPATFYHGKKTIAAAGTEEAIAASQALLQGVWVKALAANTGKVYVGKNPVTSGTGYELSAGEQVFIPTDNLADVWIDVGTNGEGATYLGS